MEPLLCPNCKTSLTEDDCFCPICGENVEGYIRKIKIERHKQLETVNNVNQTIQRANETHTFKDDTEKIKVLKRYLGAFCFTLAASIIGMLAVLFGASI